MCVNSEQFIRQYAEHVVEVRKAINKLADFGKNNELDCMEVKLAQILLLNQFVDPLQQVNAFVTEYCMMRNLPFPDGFEQIAQKLAELGVEVRRV